MKKITALAVGLLVFGFAFAAARDKTQSQEQAQVKAQTKAQTKTAVQTQTKSEFSHQYRIAFIDENGDGINDLAKDADGDGIPNGQDPDWVKPQDGTGYQEQHKNGQSDKAGMGQGRKSGQSAKASFGKGSFRTGMQGAGRTTGAGVCDGTGPKGTAQRKGRR